MSHRDREASNRAEIAREAANILVRSGHRDFGAAKRKAAERLGARGALPSNAEIETALIEHQRLFRGDSRQAYVRELYNCAIETLALFASFHARAIGPLVTGNADENCGVTLHLFAESQEEVADFLVRHEIPYRATERRVRVSATRTERIPSYEFAKEQVHIELLVFALAGRRQAPLSPIDGRPMKRVTTAALAALYAPKENSTS